MKAQQQGEERDAVEFVGNQRFIQIMNRDTIALLNPVIQVIVHFLGQPITEGTSDFERKLLAAIQANNSGLVLFRAEGLFRNTIYFWEDKMPVYKLHSAAHGSELVFTLDKWRGMPAAVVLMLNTAITKQGNFFRLKDFFLNRAARCLFAVGIPAIVGDAQPNFNPVRNQKRDFRRERTKDGTPKLVRLYEYLGFCRAKGNNMVMMPADFIRAVGCKRFNKTVIAG